MPQTPCQRIQYLCLPLLSNLHHHHFYPRIKQVHLMQPRLHSTRTIAHIHTRNLVRFSESPRKKLCTENNHLILYHFSPPCLFLQTPAANTTTTIKTSKDYPLQNIYNYHRSITHLRVSYRNPDLEEKITKTKR